MLGRYLRVPTTAAPDTAQEQDEDHDPLAIELRPLSWKEELTSSVSDSFLTRVLLLLAPILPNQAPSFTTLRKLFILFIVLSGTLFLVSQAWLRRGSILRVRTPPCPNAFRLPGTLHVNLTSPPDNYWIPDIGPQFPPQCSNDPPRLLESLQAFVQSPSAEPPPDLAPLQHRTVLLFGDSIDRNHLEHFCAFLSLSPQVIYPSDAVYPSSLRDIEATSAAIDRGGQEYGTDRSRPWTCHVPPLDLLLVWVFYLGSDDGWTTPGPPVLGGETPPRQDDQRGRWGRHAFWPSTTEHFNPPLKAEDRLDMLARRLVENLGRGSVDLVEIGVGGWDLDMAKRLDNLAAKWVLAHQPNEQGWTEDSLTEQLIKDPLDPVFYTWVQSRLNALVQHALSVFPSSVPIYLRALPTTPQNYHWPYLISQQRIQAMRGLASEVVGDHRKEQTTWWGGRRRPRLRMDNNDAHIEGKANHEDHIHPRPLPGSWIWSEWLLYALSRSVQRNRQ